MNWFVQLWTTESVASGILILAAVAVVGLAAGSVSEESLARWIRDRWPA